MDEDYSDLAVAPPEEDELNKRFGGTPDRQTFLQGGVASPPPDQPAPPAGTLGPSAVGVPETPQAPKLGPPPNRADFPTLHYSMARRIGQGIGGALLAKWGSPVGTQILEHAVNPASVAEEKYGQAEKAYQNQLGNQKEQATTADLTSQAGLRNEQTTQLKDSGKFIGKTVKVGTKTMLWNPATRNYDIEVGSADFKTPQEGYAHAVQDATAHGRDPSTDPAVQYWADAITAIQKPQKTTAEEDTARAEKIRQDQNLGKPVSPEDAAWLKSHNTEKTLVPAANVTLNEPKVNDARIDKSYQFHSQRMDALAKPIQDRAERLSRLTDTLNQGTPQADALVAPELLSVMAGGQASGLRMNEAEISRIVGGRNHWQDLKAKIDAWQLDPNKGFALTPSQRQQTRDLFAAVQERVNQKSEAIMEARGKMVDSDDPKEHRRIYADLEKKLAQIDSGKGGGNTEAQGGGTVTMKAPNGQTKEVPADQVEHYKSLGATEVKKQ